MSWDITSSEETPEHPDMTDLDPSLLSDVHGSTSELHQTASYSPNFLAHPEFTTGSPLQENEEMSPACSTPPSPWSMVPSPPSDHLIDAPLLAEFLSGIADLLPSSPFRMDFRSPGMHNIESPMDTHFASVPPGPWVSWPSYVSVHSVTNIPQCPASPPPTYGTSEENFPEIPIKIIVTECEDLAADGSGPPGSPPWSPDAEGDDDYNDDDDDELGAALELAMMNDARPPLTSVSRPSKVSF